MINILCVPWFFHCSSAIFVSLPAMIFFILPNKLKNMTDVPTIKNLFHFNRIGDICPTLIKSPLHRVRCAQRKYQL